MEGSGDDIDHNSGCEQDINHLIHGNLQHSHVVTPLFLASNAEDATASAYASPAVRSPPSDFTREKKNSNKNMKEHQHNKPGSDHPATHGRMAGHIKDSVKGKSEKNRLVELMY